MFSKEKLTINIEGQEIVLEELSTSDFNDVMSYPESEQGYNILARSIVSPKVTIEDVKDFPNRISTQLLSEVVKLNGLDTSGN